ncbi:dipeptide ABC transporter ATP-binding protein [Agrobacterium rosae]|uniref:ABC transporter ATP-binding protein n=1 Tax=Agrobacterium rosae TaxID=1972867 RepID=A0AAE5RV05_9HYPH|nr:ABC transporter ATP-binding protein [Agrobacterium rosae]KAA3515386.1 ABC transporter ATP-binding protein [Agrobacterium rosae]KAA3524353.1 ABC transporter ATP-binding protein [Agrobacterium rosae]MCM2431249.1 ABC transporter ATP-binding protein [Agrobacterium rosae]MDX8329085.1 ABC transporter ATP-binding protein [Agrobacterium rosae]MQB46700.1 ABC transporter ATP-binding protein [Agrobacterium rosae]
MTPTTTATSATPLLDVTNLKTWFPNGRGEVKAVDGISFSVAPGEVLGLVGESGSGKSITGFSIIGLIDEPGRIVGGSIKLEGGELVGLPAHELRAIRGKVISMVFQDPMMTLNPVLSIGTQIKLALEAHENISSSDARERAIKALAQVRISDPERKVDFFPHQFSGGMRQRVAIAIALLHRPKLIICDEPTTALDVSIQAEILAEMKELVADLGTALIWISHDLAVVSSIADRVAVMKSGKIVEIGPALGVLIKPQHEYTKALLEALPSRAKPGELLLRGSGIADAEPPPRKTATANLPPLGSPYLVIDNAVKRFEKPVGLLHGLAIRSGLSQPVAVVKAVDGVSITVNRGEVVGLVGESGSGKSTLGRMAAGITVPTSGAIRLNGQPVMSAGRSPSKITTRIQTIFQDPFASLNGRMRIGDIVAEGPLAHRLVSRAEAPDYVRKWLAAVGLDPTFANRFPHQFSGGQRQRIAIARALAMQPDVIVCDEPVASLDVSIQAQIINLLIRLRTELDLSLLFISHDLSVVRHLCDRVAIMYQGRIVEEGETSAIYANPQHDYTKRLLAAVPVLPQAAE